MFIYSFVWKSESLRAVVRLFESGCFIKKERKRLTQFAEIQACSWCWFLVRASRQMTSHTELCERGTSKGAQMRRERKQEGQRGQVLCSSLITWSCGTNWSLGDALPTVLTVDNLKISTSFQHLTRGQASSKCASGFRETHPRIIQAMLLGWVSRLWLGCSSSNGIVSYIEKRGRALEYYGINNHFMGTDWKLAPSYYKLRYVWSLASSRENKPALKEPNALGAQHGLNQAKWAHNSVVNVTKY